MEIIDISEQSIVDLSPELMKVLLKDKTTGKNILWATNQYEHLGEFYRASQEITPGLITGKYTYIIQPRVSKSLEEQTWRTRDKAEVFTPSWICNQQNNLLDESWFGISNVFNVPDGKKWKTKRDKIVFPDDKRWQEYVDARRLEISCGEAPYLVSRYDTVTGNIIPIEERIGLLDRKLRIVNENTNTEEDWMKWTIRAFQSSYGYEFQGDNVLLARENLLQTFIDYYVVRFGQQPTLVQTKKIATIISWNIWQMDGITMTAPYSEAPPLYEQMTIFDFLDDEESTPVLVAIPCKIYDWRSNTSVEFRSIRS